MQRPAHPRLGRIGFETPCSEGVTRGQKDNDAPPPHGGLGSETPRGWEGGGQTIARKWWRGGRGWHAAVCHDFQGGDRPSYELQRFAHLHPPPLPTRAGNAGGRTVEAHRRGSHHPQGCGGSPHCHQYIYVMFCYFH